MLACCSFLRRASSLDRGICNIRGSHCVDHRRVPNLSEHDRPCEPLAETGALPTQVSGSHMADPSRRPTTTLTASSLNLRLNVVSGRACNQSEACEAMEALRRARS